MQTWIKDSVALVSLVSLAWVLLAWSAILGLG